MAALIFIIPAVILLITAILVYSVFGLLLGSFAAIGTAHKVAPQKIGITIVTGVVTTFVTSALIGTGGSTLENGLIFLISLCVGSVAMLILALIFAGSAKLEDQGLELGEQPVVEHQIKKDISDGGWGLRKSSYSDGQHREAAKQRERDRRKAQKNRASNLNNPF